MSPRRLNSLIAISVLVAAGCTTQPAPTSTTQGTTSTPAAPESSIVVPDDMTLALETVADGFVLPVHAVSDGGRLYVVDQPGEIWVMDEGEPETFLDIRSQVGVDFERGLLGLAFHPEHADVLYINYTGLDGATNIVEYRFDRDGANRDSARTVLQVSQPEINHNGGMLAFGPDGMLWIGMGDGGREENAQNDGTLLGSMLRIEVGPDIDPYETPDDGAFSAAEAWAIGLRNPWRFAFDGRDLWIADVGSDVKEEINRVSIDEHGVNFGWPIYEGTECLLDDQRCGDSGYAQPVHEYRDEGDCSVIGGTVYRGAAMPELHGHYFFSDYCSGFIRSIAPSGEVFEWTDQTGPVVFATSFGVDQSGEILVMAVDGIVRRLIEGGP